MSRVGGSSPVLVPRDLQRLLEVLHMEDSENPEQWE